SLVILAEQAPATQFGNHQPDEVGQATRQGRRHDVETVRTIVLEALLELIRDLHGRSDQLPVPPRAGDPEIEIANRQSFPPCQLQQKRLPALAALGLL